MSEEIKKHYGLLGRNIQYSLSPVMHNAAFRHFNINSEYMLFDIKEQDLQDFICSAVKNPYLGGFNVTVPYKVEVKNILDGMKGLNVICDKWAGITGALNTVKVNGSEISIFNTDVLGFERALLGSGYDICSSDDVFIAGAGGVGRVICLHQGFSKRGGVVKVFDVDIEKALSLKEIAKENSADPDVFYIIEKKENIKHELRGCGLIVNATPIGTKEEDESPVPLDALCEGMTIYDVVYSRETALIREAKKKALRAVDGSAMLIAQGAESFSRWIATDLDETIKVMEKALMEKLGKIK